MTAKPSTNRSHAGKSGLLLAMLCLALSGCGAAKDAGSKGGDKAPPEVGFRVVHPTVVPIITELPGRISALETAQVRPQVAGVIRARLFHEGALVRKGQPLYQIDNSLYLAVEAQAKANLVSAEAIASSTSAKAARYRPLAAEQAISQQDYTDVSAFARQAQAAVAQNRAALQTARISLRYTTVPAPITGHIGRSLVTQGALVTGNQTDPLAVISRLDTVNVDIQQSSGDLLRLRRQLSTGGAAPIRAEVRLKLDDGSDYEFAGSLEFSEVTADPATGTVTLRAHFPNPQGLLLPGMFVRAKIAQASQAGAFLVPQVAMGRDSTGKAQVLLVGADNKAVPRSVTAERTLGDAWVVTAGLKDGDRVITQGLGKVKPGKPIKPVPESAPQGANKPGKA